MSLRSAIKSGVSAAFTAVGDIKISAFYYSANVQDPLYNYDTKTGDKIAQWNIVSPVILIPTKAENSRLIGDDWLIKPKDEIYIIEQDQLNIDVKIEDQIEINSKHWRMINFKSDPADSIYIVQLRLASAERIMSSGPTSATTGPLR